MAHVLRQRGDLQGALTDYQRALALCRASGNQLMLPPHWAISMHNRVRGILLVSTSRKRSTRLRLTEDQVGLTETQARLDALEQGTLADIDRPTTMGWVKSHVALAKGKVYCGFESPIARHKP